MRNTQSVFYHYRVKWYFDSDPTVNEGFLLAQNIAEAAAILDEHFDSIDEVSLNVVNDGEILGFEDLLDYLHHAYNVNAAIGPQVYEALNQAAEVEE